MDKFLPQLAALSLGGAAAIALAAVVRRMTEARYAARWRCWLWLILSLRLLIPVSMTGRIPVHPISLAVPENIVLVTPQTVPQPPHEASEPVPVPSGHPVPEPDIPPAPASPSRPALRLYDALGVLWAVGAAAVLLWAAGMHLRFCVYLRRWSRRVTEEALTGPYLDLTDSMGIGSPPELRICAGLDEPMLAGIFHSIILLPETPMDPQSLRYTLLHELSHYRRRDIWLKTVSLAACAVHWFNPMVWYMHHIIAQDTELACDEALLRFLPKEEYSAYCRTILDSVRRIQNRKGVRT